MEKKIASWKEGNFNPLKEIAAITGVIKKYIKIYLILGNSYQNIL